MAKFAQHSGNCARLEAQALAVHIAIKLSLWEPPPSQPPWALLTFSLWVWSPEGWWHRDDGRQGSAQGQVPAAGDQWFLCCSEDNGRGQESVSQVWSLGAAITQIYPYPNESWPLKMRKAGAFQSHPSSLNSAWIECWHARPSVHFKSRRCLMKETAHDNMEPYKANEWFCGVGGDG